MDVQAEYLKEVTVLLDMFDFLYQTQGDFVTFPTHTDNSIFFGCNCFHALSFLCGGFVEYARTNQQHRRHTTNL